MNRKTILLALLLVACSLNVLADDLITLHITFKDGAQDVTKEVEHYLTPSQITHSAHGDSITLHVKYDYDGGEDHTVTYNLADIKEISHLLKAPSINLTANQDPDHDGNYYTTFFSGLESYTLPEGVTAYTAKKNGSYARLVPVETEGVLPKDQAVLLKSTSDNIPLTVLTGPQTTAESNLLDGVDVKTEQTGSNYYVFTYGNYGIGFYTIIANAALGANKAFIRKENAPGVRAFKLMFPEDDPTGIEETLVDDEMVTGGDIYSVSGVRYNQPQKGLNIINGKKVFIK